MLSSDQTIRRINQPVKAFLGFEELKYMAYTGQHDLVSSVLRDAAPGEREKFSDKEILHQAVWGGVQRIRDLRAVQNHAAITAEIEFIKSILNQFLDTCERNGNFPRELFQSIIYVGEELINTGELDGALSYLKQTIRLGVNKFPQLRVEAVNKIALVLSRKGKIGQAIKELDKLARHPYFVMDRNQIPHIFFTLSQYYIQKGDTVNFKFLLFLGLNCFYLDEEIRRKFFDQLRLTYKRSARLLTDRKVSIVNKFIFLFHWFYYKLPNFHRIKIGSINRIALKILLGLIYIFNYYLPTENIRLYRQTYVRSYPVLIGKNSVRFENHSKIPIKRTKNILITRAMGGVGDFLMMTPGLRALKNKYPEREIHLAIPKRYFPVFTTNTDVRLIDIEEDAFSHLDYSRWYNFTDCPAARLESRKAPKVKKNRTEIFAAELGIRGLKRLRMDYKPVYYLSEEDAEFADDFWNRMKLNDKTVIGVQLHADESYRDYPLMEKLVELMSEKNTVLLFDNCRIEGFDFKNVFKIDSFSLREAFALASKCNVIIAPDSSFIHLAAAFDIPSFALFGPIDGKVRTKHYTNCTYIDIREQLGCLPCWRNESIPCKLTGMRHSACMESISVHKIINELEKKLNPKCNERS